MSCAPSTVDVGRAIVHTVRPNIQGVFPELLPGVIRNFYGDVALGNGTQWKMGAFRTRWGLFLGIEGYGAANFNSRATAAQVARLLGIVTEDAANVADLINDQLGGPASPADRQGVYRACWCGDDDGEES